MCVTDVDFHWKMIWIRETALSKIEEIHQKKKKVSEEE